MKKKEFHDPKISSSSSEASDDASDEHSDENVEDEEEELHDNKTKRGKTKNQNQRKPISDARSLMKNREHLLEQTNKKKVLPKSSKSNGLVSPYFMKSSSVKNVVNKSLSLSESSSDDENDKPVQKMTKVKSLIKKSPASSVITPKNESMILQLSDEDEVIDFSANLANLESLAKNLESKPKSPQKSVKESPKKAKTLPKSDDIASLLAKGEGVTLASYNLSDEEDEESKNKDKSNATENEEPIKAVSIELPQENVMRKRKKKGFDVEAWVRRELGRAQRELQMLKHQTHVLCLIGHLKYLNSYAAFPPADHNSAQLLLATAMSIIPTAHYVPAKDLDMIRLSAFVSWFKSAFQCLKDEDLNFPEHLDDWILRALENFICVSPVQRVLIFLLAARSMGWPTRLVLNLETISVKPEKSLGANLSDILGECSKTKDPDYVPNENVEKESKTKYSKSAKKIEDESDGESPKKKAKKDSSRPSKSSKKETSKYFDDSKNKKEKSVCKSKNELNGEISNNNNRREPSKPSKSSKKDDPKKAKDTTKYFDNSKKDADTIKKDVPKSNKSSKKDSKIAKPKNIIPQVDGNDSSDDDFDLEEENFKPQKRVKCKKGVEKASKNSKTDEKSSSKTFNKSASNPKNISKTDQKERKSRKYDEGASKKLSEKTKNSPSSTKILRLSESALYEASQRKTTCKRATKSEYFTRTNSDSESDFEPEPTKRKLSKLPRNTEKKTTTTKKCKSSSNASKKKGVPYWIEVYIAKSGWVTVDIAEGRVNCTPEMEERCGIKPMLYVIAANADGTLKDVTKRYGGERFDTQIRKARIATETWFQETLAYFTRKNRKSIDEEEDKFLESISSKAPMPTTVGAFKDHPLYALSRHLLKFEAIYPADAPPLGFIRSEPIYARECVHLLHCRISWLKAGRVVRIGEEPYKVVKARPKWDRMSGQMLKDQPLEIFGKWQTELYIPPPAKDGKVPRNEYGNVELFQPWMLPKGTVHIPIQGKECVGFEENLISRKFLIHTKLRDFFKTIVSIDNS